MELTTDEDTVTAVSLNHVKNRLNKLRQKKIGYFTKSVTAQFNGRAVFFISFSWDLHCKSKA